MYISNTIMNAFDGMMVYYYISNSKNCINNINSYVQNIINSSLGAYWFVESPEVRDYFEYALFNYTDSLSRFSPILRYCYEVGGEVDENWDYYWD